MAKIKRKGEAGAAKNYITRNQALKKLQVTLADFRRLCILKGIYPREPLHKKRANKGSSAPASFYYHKDVQYLLHEPLLHKFRAHKAFAKKLARALGRGEYALAHNLEASKPVARLDHIVKERYPTFTLALQDLQDPLNLVHLFSNLPSKAGDGKTAVPVEVIAECSRLINEWKVWAIRTHSLRKIFLGIKGVYYECLVPGHGGELVPVRWLEGYEFQQHVPSDVDFRILLTFLELYRTLVGFVLYKLYTDENLVYPPPLDVELDESGESVGAFRLIEARKAVGVAGDKKVSKKEVKRAIKGIAEAGAAGNDVDMAEDDAEDVSSDADADETADGGDDFVERPGTAATDDVAGAAPLPTYTSLLASASAPSSSSLLFSPYTFYLSRETSSRTWEFVVRAMGGRVVTSLSAPSLADAPADGITHVLVDRPIDDARRRELERGRKWTWVQPQWVADCVNRGRILGADEYAPGKLLPPHLSPWDGDGEPDRPWLEDGQVEAAGAAGVDEGVDEDEDVEADVVDEDEDDEDDEGAVEQAEAAPAKAPAASTAYPPALLAAAQDPSDPTLLHAAELEAEANGTSHAAFRAQLKAATKAAKSAGAKAGKAPAAKAKDEDLRKIMMTNKKAKLYEKMKYGNAEKQAEKAKLEAKRVAIEKRKRKEARTGKA